MSHIRPLLVGVVLSAVALGNAAMVSAQEKTREKAPPPPKAEGLKKLVEQIFDILARIRDEGTTVLLVEQNAAMALDLADRAYVLETGLIKLAGTGKALAQDADVQRAYLGVGP